MSSTGQLEHIRQFLATAELARRIANSAVSWEDKYDLIFSAHVAGRIRETGVRFDWADPDTSYEDDVRAYVSTVTTRADELRPLTDL